jgi:hypothetical protein
MLRKLVFVRQLRPRVIFQFVQLHIYVKVIQSVLLVKGVVLQVAMD